VIQGLRALQDLRGIRGTQGQGVILEPRVILGQLEQRVTRETMAIPEQKVLPGSPEPQEYLVFPAYLVSLEQMERTGRPDPQAILDQ
jgi:hypothetical protein